MSAAEFARVVLATIGAVDGDVEPLAEGMSSSAWVGNVDGRPMVARVPKNDGLRPLPRYAAEVALLDVLAARGVPVPPTTVVEIDGAVCTVAPLVAGQPVDPGDWTDELVADLARSLHTLHSLPPVLATESNIVARFHLARIWPFDGSSLDDHPVQQFGAEIVQEIERAEEAILAAGSARPGVVHTDLHPDHLLVTSNGRLAGILDFGDAFAGPAAWDLACLRYYHGNDVAQRVADAYPNGEDLRADVDNLGIAWGLYKLAKTPTRKDVIARVLAMLRSAV